MSGNLEADHLMSLKSFQSEIVVEYLSVELSILLLGNGFKHEPYFAYTPRRSGVAEK